MDETSTTLRELVFEALNNAVDNGFAEATINAAVEEVATDLLDYDAAIAEVVEHIWPDEVDHDRWASEIIPYIEAWRADRHARDGRL